MVETVLAFNNAWFMKRVISSFIACILAICCHAQSIITDRLSKASFPLTGAVICVDPADDPLVLQSANLLQQDIEMVTGMQLRIVSSVPATTAIIIGSMAGSLPVTSPGKKEKINTSILKNKWEAYLIQSTGNQLIVTGSDKRGTAYGVFELSRQLGVSPWYWWADVPVEKKTSVYIKKNISITDAPKVKYRGIFINDEAPALANWSREKFGGFNHHFYEKVFELLLRLKGNYIWPAMWGNAFYDDDSLNITTAERYGIVIGTSHHEPMMRAHDEWRRYGTGQWNYDSNSTRLKAFWRTGFQRAINEKIVTIGMRGDGDEPMSEKTATTLLERIVADQRQIITEVTGKPAGETPQLWALYKEVQDYYDKGMRVPDDVTLLLCDDNWGNIRRLPSANEKKRKGGYGIYYHFDYVGGPRNYKWINTNSIARVWEQMHLAWAYNAREIWIVNVGDIKPMEFPASFFLDYAWNPENTGPGDLQRYTEKWAADQFGEKYAKDIASVITAYTTFNARRKPELLDAGTYSLPDEWATVVNDYNNLLKKADAINEQLPATYRSAYFQLVLHPVKASANLNTMYYNVAQNREAYKNKWPETNTYADNVKRFYLEDSLITTAYHQLNNGKWNHMMDQAHIGYTNWQQPPQQKMPEVQYLSPDSIIERKTQEKRDLKRANIPAGIAGNIFYEEEEKGVSIAAAHFTRAIHSNNIRWKVLPAHGRTGGAITTFPVTATAQQPVNNAPHVEYDFYTYSKGDVSINTYCSPTLNFHNSETGLQYAVSIDDEAPQIISINKAGNWDKWVAENIITRSSKHKLLTPGKHTLKYWMVNSGVVLQKLVLDFGNVKKSYLGSPETILNQ